MRIKYDSYRPLDDCRRLRISRMAIDQKIVDLHARIDRARTSDASPELPPVEAHAQDIPPEISDTDIANGQRLAARHGQDLRFTVERGWLVWDGRRWAVDEKGVQVQARAKETALSIFDEIKDSPDRDARMRHAKRSQSKGAIESMIWLARSEPGIATRLTTFDADGWLFNVANGTIDLRTGELRPHRREDLISNLVEIVFDPTAE